MMRWMYCRLWGHDWMWAILHDYYSGEKGPGWYCRRCLKVRP